MKKETEKPLNIPYHQRTQMAKALNRLLANYKIHYRKLIQFHWHANANQAPSLQSQIERYTLDAERRIDQIATVIIKLQHIPIGSMSTCMRHASITTTMKSTSVDNIVKMLINDLQVLKEQTQLLTSQTQYNTLFKNLGDSLLNGLGEKLEELAQSTTLSNVC